MLLPLVSSQLRPNACRWLPVAFARANRELAGSLAVSSVPTVLAFQGGQEVGRLVGLRPESAYRELLEAAGVS